MKEVEKIFDAHVDAFFDRATVLAQYNVDPYELKRFIKNHERKPVVMERMFGQLYAAEHALKIDAPKYTSLIHAVAELFIRAAMDAKRKETMSLNELKMLEAKKAMEEEFDKIAIEEGFFLNETPGKPN